VLQETTIGEEIIMNPYELDPMGSHTLAAFRPLPVSPRALLDGGAPAAPAAGMLPAMLRLAAHRTALARRVADALVVLLAPLPLAARAPAAAAAPCTPAPAACC
jgi:hypothetical protein